MTPERDAAYEAFRATLPPSAEAWPAEPDGRGGVRFVVDHPEARPPDGAARPRREL